MEENKLNICLCMQCDYEFETEENNVELIRCPRCNCGDVDIEEEVD